MNRGPVSELQVPLYLLAPQAVGTTPVNGTAIVRPWERGRLLTVTAFCGALVAADALTTTFQVRRLGTSTWDTVKENDGTTNLGFTVAKLSDTGAAETGVIFGSIDLSRLKAGTNLNSAYEYDALRLSVVNANNTTPGICAFVGHLSDLYSYPAKDLSGNDVSDDLYFKQLPHTA